MAGLGQYQFTIMFYIIEIIMKKLVLFIGLIIFCSSCEKNNFDIDNPNVKIFVKQLKNGTYDKYAKNEKGENLWLIMPEFNKRHIPLLIELSQDTTHIEKFPINPLSSRLPFPGERDYFILGEGLLWIVEGIITETTYPSLDPFLIDTSRDDTERYKGLTTHEILMIQEIYTQWWNKNKHEERITEKPLENTSFRWF